MIKETAAVHIVDTHVLRGTILNRAYGAHINLYIYSAIFANIMWS